MLQFFGRLFDTADFPPRWQCGHWTDGHGWLHILSDLAVWSAYFAIPVVLVYFAQRRRDVPFRSIFWLFGAFILACGTTHLMEAVIFWHPAYRLAGLIKLLTAVVSWATVLALVPIVPKALAMRGPEELEREIERRTAELEQANGSLQAEIRERERVEQEITRLNRELKSRADELQTILDLIPIGVAIAHDPQCRRITHNPYLSELTGIPAWENASLSAPPGERAMGYTLRCHGHEVPVAELPMQVACTGVAVRDVELDLVCEGRPPRQTLFSARPLYDEQRRVRGSVGACLDITERNRVEAALRQSEQRFARFMQHLPGLAWIKDLDGRYVYVNDAAEKAFCTPRARLYGLTDDAVFPPEVARQFRVHDRQALASETGVQVIETLVHADGVRHSSVVSKFPISDADGQVALVGGMAIDITDRLHAEELLHAANRRKDEFVATLAHELRNPLAPIRNALEILKRAGDDAALAGQARAMMERQLIHMVRLVDDLLDLSRITRGKVQLRRTRVELDAVLRSAVETARPFIEAQGHELTVSVPPEPIHLNADLTRLSQIVANLLHNAAKYTERGGHIWLSVERQDGAVVISVRDTGMGIPADSLPHIFEMFAQAVPALQRAHGGLGIGLALVRGLVELHGGTVEARSAGAGMGSEFVVRLPGVEVPAQPPESPADGHLASGGPTFRVLVVDDNHDAAESLGLMLRLMGHQVHLAHDGVEAVQAAATCHPDVALLDIGMPRMNGYEAAQHIRRQPGGQVLTLIAVTGWGQEDDKKRASEAGFDHHMTKPIDPAALERLLAQLAPRA